VNVADLIIRGLGGQHLHGLLPGNDNQAAISHAWSGHHGWSGPGEPFGEVTADGIGCWKGPGWTYHPRRPPRTAVLFVTWPEILAIIARGCGEGRRAAYEAAYEQWGQRARSWCADNLERSQRPGVYGPPVPYPDQALISETTAALIRHGCERIEVQDALF
jgi:hypothetical protein